MFVSSTVGRKALLLYKHIESVPSKLLADECDFYFSIENTVVSNIPCYFFLSIAS